MKYMKEMEEALLPDEKWVSLSSVLGRCSVLPASVAAPLKKRIAAIKKKHDIIANQGWRIFSILLGAKDGQADEI
jgi:hypothetical protein